MTRLALWDPFRDIADFRYSIDRVFDRGFGRPFRLVNWDAVTELFPVDVYETDDEVMVKASLPGVQPDKVEISVTGNKLTIKGESSEESDETGSTYHRQELRRGAFYRALRLPSRVDADQADATFENGVLSLRLPKAADVRPKVIEVKAKTGKAKAVTAGSAS